MDKYTHLVVNDTNNVINYIYASTKYKFIRGASALLDMLNLEEMEQIIEKNNGKKLSAGGGETRVLFKSAEDASNYRNAIEQLYLQHTDHVTLTTALIERQANEKMVDWLLRSEQTLRHEEVRSGKKKVHQIELVPFMKRCESCYTRAAEKHEKKVYLYAGEIAVCKSCYNKYEMTEKLKEVASGSALEDLGGLSEVQQRLAAKKEGTAWIQSIEKLFESQQAGQKMGFIYADGKKIGSLFKNLTDRSNNQTDAQFIEEYIEKSTKLHEALITAAVRTHEALGKANINVAVDYALIGGDDLAAIMPGEIALLYTNYLLKFFKEETKKAFQKEYELAAGVVIVKKSFPIHQLFNLAYELMDRTKNRNDESAFDFQYILDSNVQSIAALRSDSPLNKRYLNLEGFSLKQGEANSFESIYKVVQNLKNANFPNSKIKGIYHITTESNLLTLDFQWQEWLSRLDKKHRAAITQWYVAKDGTYPLEKTPYIIEKDGYYYTPIRDLFEIYDLVDKEIKLS